MRGIRAFPRNLAGCDYVVGDIHGHFDDLHAELEAIGFDFKDDRLFSVGDMIDRGPDSRCVLEWLREPWFHAVRGNHEEMAMSYARGQYDAANYRRHGGGWFINLARDEQRAYAQHFEQLPVAMQVPTVAGLVGIVHADCPVGNWRDLMLALAGPRGAEMQAVCQWGQNRIAALDDGGVAGVRAVVVGHTPRPNITSLGNVLYIDTGMSIGGKLSIIDLDTLELARRVDA